MPHEAEPASAEEFHFPPGAYHPEQEPEAIDWRDLARRCMRKSIARKRRMRELPSYSGRL